MYRGQDTQELALEPAAFDILCGKDKTFNKHQGNQIFRQLIVSSQEVYNQAESKQDKMKITREIVQKLRSEYGARFLKLHKGQWEEISDQVARDKVSHALRFLLKAVPKAPKVKPNQRRSRCKPTASSSHLMDVSFSSSGSSGSSSCAGSLSSHDDNDWSHGEDEDEDAVVEILFERQRSILKALRFDDHLEEEIGISNKRLSIIDRSIFLPKLMKTDSKSTMPSILENPSKQPFNEFDSLRSEDLEALLNEPIDFHLSQEWDYDPTQ